MLKNKIYWSILLIWSILGVFMFFIFHNLYSPIYSFEDLGKVLGYGLIFCVILITPIFYTIKLVAPSFIPNFKIWVTPSKNTKFVRRTSFSLRKFRFVKTDIFRVEENQSARNYLYTILAGLTVIHLGLVPLYLNEIYANAPLKSFYATVIRKHKSQSVGRHNTSYSVSIKNQAGFTSNIGSLAGVYKKLEKGDVIKLTTRKGRFGIHFYVSIYKNDIQVYP